MSISWNEIVEIYRTQPWWVWMVGLGLVWITIKWLRSAAIAHAERPIIMPNGFKQRRVYVDYRSGTITMPRGDTYPVSNVRGVRWEDFAKSGQFHVYIEVDDLKRPIHPVSFSTSDASANFVGRLRTAIEKAGGARFSAAAGNRFDIMPPDFGGPSTAGKATESHIAG